MMLVDGISRILIIATPVACLTCIIFGLMHMTDIVLLSKDYAYWGSSGPEIPSKFRDYDG